MRNLPEISVIIDGSSHSADTVDLKTWQAEANSEDLYYLYLGEVINNTHFEFHELFFKLDYKHYSARYFGQELLKNFRELVNERIVVEEIRARAETVEAEEQRAKDSIAAMIAEMRAARGK